MNIRRAFRLGSLAFVSALVGANYLPSRCVVEGPIVEPSPAPVNSLQEEVDRLNAVDPGYALDTKDLTALTRMLYFEDKFDPKLDGDAEQTKGYVGVAEVILNRYLFDTCSDRAPVPNPTCGRENVHLQYDGHDGLVGIILKEHNGVHQFSSLSQSAQFFTDGSLEKGLNYVTGTKKKDGKDVPSYALDQHQMELAYAALVGVLDGSIAPETDGALYYKNTAVTNAKNKHLVKWDDEKAFDDTQLECGAITHMPPGISDLTGNYKCRVETQYDHHYDRRIGSHDYYTVKEDTHARTEIVWDNAQGKTYVDGVLRPSQSKAASHKGSKKK